MVPLLVSGGLVAAIRKDVAKRMSDMTGYTAKEKLFTVAASLTPYLFALWTLWTPFTKSKTLLACGIPVYLTGMAAFLATIYVVFLGVCLATANAVLSGILVLLLVLQHFMILAEERACRNKYGVPYAQYAERVPRYLAMF
jgi:protein-S-isoprenylcysteine O-methyltransferase Ste14